MFFYNVCALTLLVFFFGNVSANNSYNILSTVALIRHCPRSTIDYPQKIHPPRGYTDNSNYYSSLPWPSESQWGVSAGMCTVEGLKQTELLGRKLSQRCCSKNGRREKKVHFIIDINQRDSDTFKALSRGFGNGTSYSFSYLDVFHDKSCRDKLNKKAKIASLQKQILSYQKPPNYVELINKLQAILGYNATVKYLISTMTNDVSDDGDYIGKVASAGSLSEVLLLERMSKLKTVGWGLVDDIDIAMLMPLNSYWENVARGHQYIAQREGSGLLSEMTTRLMNSSMASTSFFIGHDTNIAALCNLLGLMYEDSLFGFRATPPLAQLQFQIVEKKDDRSLFVKASYFSIGFGFDRNNNTNDHDYNNKSNQENQEIPVYFSSFSSPSSTFVSDFQSFLQNRALHSHDDRDDNLAPYSRFMPLQQFYSLTQKVIDKSCT